MKNPNWTREEMILAADVADDLCWRGVNPSTPRVMELSALLRTANIHDPDFVSSTFRSPNSVSRKINNLRASHPDTHGVGLRSSASERPIVDEFLTDRTGMKSLARTIWEELSARAKHKSSLH